MTLLQDAIRQVAERKDAVLGVDSTQLLYRPDPAEALPTVRLLLSGLDADALELADVALHIAAVAEACRILGSDNRELLAGAWFDGFLAGAAYRGLLDKSLETETPAEVTRRAVLSGFGNTVPKRYWLLRTLARVAAKLRGH